MPSIFEYTEHDFFYAKAIILLYLYESEDSTKDKLKVVNQYLERFPRDKSFTLFQTSLLTHKELPTPDTMISQDIIDLSYEEMVEDIESIPGKADVEIHLNQLVEIDRILRYREAHNRLIKRKNLSLEEMQSFLNQWGSGIAVEASQEQDNSHTAVLTRLQDKQGDIHMGIREIDGIARGFRKGNTLAIGGFAGAGKTTLMLSMLYHNVVNYKKNCLFITFEVTTDEVRGWLISRHSKHPKFAGKGKPIDRVRISEKGMTPEEFAFLTEVVAPDLFENEEYGKITILCHQDIPSLEIHAFKNTIYSHAPDADIIFFDYIQATKNYIIHGITDEFRQMNYLIRGFDIEIAKNYFGEEVLFVVGVQINRDKFAKAKANYEKGIPPYDNDCWSGVNEVERTAYYAITAFSNEILMESQEVLIQFLKHRGGKKRETAITTHIIPQFLEIGDGVTITRSPEEDKITDIAFMTTVGMEDEMEMDDW